MGFFSRFERRVEDGFEGINEKLFDAPISPVQIEKKAEKQMRREKMVGAGKEFAPTLYTILVNPDDDQTPFWILSNLGRRNRNLPPRKGHGARSCYGRRSPCSLYR